MVSRRRIIYDPGEPVVLRDYNLEALAFVDQSILESADIPSMIRYDRAAEIMQRIFLLVRREHLKQAKEILNAPPADVDEDDAGEVSEP